MSSTNLQPPYLAAELSNSQTLLATLRQLRQSVYTEGQELFQEWRSRIQRPVFVDSSLKKPQHKKRVGESISIAFISHSAICHCSDKELV